MSKHGFLYQYGLFHLCFWFFYKEYLLYAAGMAGFDSLENQGVGILEVDSLWGVRSRLPGDY